MDYDNHMSGKQSSEGMAIASLVLGILALISICCYYLSPALGGLSIILGLLSRAQGPLRGQAKAGIILSSIALTIAALFWLLLLVFSFSTLEGSSGFQNLPVIPEVPEMPLDNLLTIWSYKGLGGGVR